MTTLQQIGGTRFKFIDRTLQQHLPRFIIRDLMARSSPSNSGSATPPKPRGNRSPRRSPIQDRSPPRQNDDPEEEPKVYISGLPEGISKDVVRGQFAQFGEITDLFVLNKSGFSIAFVTFESHEQSRRAISEMSGREIQGKAIRCAQAKPRRQQQQRGMDGNNRGKGCFKCGQEGHFARECPNGDQGNMRGRGRGSRGRPSDRDNYRNRSNSPRQDRRRGHRKRSSSSSRSQDKRRKRRASSSKSDSRGRGRNHQGKRAKRRSSSSRSR